MKKIFITMAVCITAISMKAQDVSDAVLFSSENVTGTARYRAMSGAFGALGGDLSAIGNNPASSAVFLNSTASLSISGYTLSNDSFYGDGLAINDDTSGKLNQLGGVFVFNNRNENAAFKKFTLGLNYNLTQNLDDEYFAFGETQNSIDQFFLENAQGIPLDLLQLQDGESISSLYSFLGETQGYAAQQAFLGFQGFIIDPEMDDPDNTTYISNLTNGNFLQDYAYRSNGLNGKFSINGGAQINDDLYLGVNLNTHFIDYERQTVLFETNNNSGSGINEIFFENNLRTFGNGFSAQVGGIYKVSSMFRLGLSLETPTWYNISEETTQYLDTFSNDEGSAVVNPNVINIYPEYNFKTPGKYTLSGAILFGKQGLISLDYSYKDYSNTEFDSQFNSSNTFADLNNNIKNTLQGATSINIGGEYRIREWSLRGGFRYQESPYKDETTIGDLKGYSAGFGYDFGNIKLGLAYDIYEQDRSPQLYSIGLTNRANINTTNSSFTATLSFGL
jgi:hypothetical protein